jgi:cytochrome c peroxidase
MVTKLRIKSIWLWAILWIVQSSCIKSVEIPPENPDIVRLDYPSYFPLPHYNFESSTLTRKKIELGRQLFYDPILSSDSTISCASCHIQQAAFADPGKQFSAGVNQQLGLRNSPSMFNLIWNTSFMWDGGVNHIEIMPFSPLTQPNEMNEDMKNILVKLNKHPEYSKRFYEAFMSKPITTTQFFYAFAQFMGSMLSVQSKYDEVKQGKQSFSPSELNGYKLYQQFCSSCHVEPLFTNFIFENNGLDTFFKDEGRYRINLDSSDLGKFKTPSLRNVALTSPYMHDGRFVSLEDVINHYNNGIRTSKTLSPKLPLNRKLSLQEEQDIISFLNTLTDSAFVADKALSNPF